ncbi:hypothetical protein AVEN_219566-1 [Araneus ventricosus]|uniref:Uncharacterized protein n=1 Tax=Araneus ventricosus TaxID=182803 RepID=A0A4Y2VSX4_ARAVE|nr:hypothetical protein AVEN_219566-1 [Araneus ventricosus]
MSICWSSVAASSCWNRLPASYRSLLLPTEAMQSNLLQTQEVSICQNNNEFPYGHSGLFNELYRIDKKTHHGEAMGNSSVSKDTLPQD